MNAVRTLAALIGFIPLALAGQVPDSVPPCDGKVISAIELTTQPPGIIGRDPSSWRRVVQNVLLMSSTTKERVAHAYLIPRVGGRCSESLVRETARVLRTQPAIGSARVQAVNDGASGVRLTVETFDEIPLIISGAYSDGNVSDLSFGNANLLGSGLYVVGRWRDGKAFRDGLSLGLRQYALFDRPVTVSLDLVRNPLGSHVAYALTRPFLSEYQRTAWHVGGQQSRTYYRFARPSGPSLLLPVRRDIFAIGGIGRIAWRNRGLLVGPITTYERVRPGNSVVATDSGLAAPDTNAIDNKYGSYDAVRVGAAIGVRLLSFTTARGFDALAADQDIARGVQIGAIVTPGVGGSNGNDFLALNLYAGVGGARSFAGLRMQWEGERASDGGWNAVVLSGRGAWYLKPSDKQTIVASAEFSGAWREQLPVQLSLGDARAGVRGFKDAPLHGGRRAVFRLEQRNPLFDAGSVARMGTAFFADVGNVWAGDVPFGVTTAGRASVGTGLLLALPQNSRRLIRADVSIPVSGDAPKRWLLRVAVTDGTRTFWRDPSDLAGARAGSPASSIFGWP